MQNGILGIDTQSLYTEAQINPMCKILALPPPAYLPSVPDLSRSCLFSLGAVVTSVWFKWWAHWHFKIYFYICMRTVVLSFENYPLTRSCSDNTMLLNRKEGRSGRWPSWQNPCCTTWEPKFRSPASAWTGTWWSISAILGMGRPSLDGWSSLSSQPSQGASEPMRDFMYSTEVKNEWDGCPKLTSALHGHMPAHTHIWVHKQTQGLGGRKKDGESWETEASACRSAWLNFRQDSYWLEACSSFLKTFL